MGSLFSDVYGGTQNGGAISPRPTFQTATDMTIIERSAITHLKGVVMVRWFCVLAVVILAIGLFRGWFSYSVDTDKVQSDLQKAKQMAK